MYHDALNRAYRQARRLWGGGIRCRMGQVREQLEPPFAAPPRPANRHQPAPPVLPCRSGGTTGSLPTPFDQPGGGHTLYGGNNGAAVAATAAAQHVPGFVPVGGCGHVALPYGYEGLQIVVNQVCVCACVCVCGGGGAGKFSCEQASALGWRRPAT